MAQPSIFQRYADNILINAGVWSTPAPSATYDVDTLLTHQPAARVRWGTGTVTLRFHGLGGTSPSTPARADVLVIPVWNVDAGSAVARLTSDTGMDVAITVPTMMPSGIPRTTAVDLTVLEPDANQRTANDYFDLIITGNSEDLIMGGHVGLYGPKRTLTDRDWHWGFQRSQSGRSIVHENDYGTDLVYSRSVRSRQLSVSTLATDAEAEALELWADANFGNGLPCLLWPIPDVYEAYFGRLDAVHTQQTDFTDAVSLALTFTEISKGKPVA
jgi:hypothetical protein